MESLQKLMPFFQDQLSQWYQLTLDRPDYAAVVAIAVWLLMAIFYSIRIGFLKKDIGKLAKANSDTQAALETAQTHGKTLQQQISEINGQLQQVSETAKSEARRANDKEQRLIVCNQQLADSLASLVDSFELNLHNLPAAGAENLLTEFQSVVARVVERFKKEQDSKTQLQLSYHAESAKLAEKEMLISSLQHRLDTQTQQLAQMELAIEQYETAQRQLQADKEQLLAQAVAKQEAEAARLADLERQQVEDANKAVEEAKVKAEAAKAANLEKQQAEMAARLERERIERSVQQPAPVDAPKPSEPQLTIAEVKPNVAKTESRTSVERASVTEKPSAVDQSSKKESGKLKGFFGKTMDKIAKMDEKMGVKPNLEASAEQAEAGEAKEAKIVEAKPENVAPHEENVGDDKKAPKPSEGFAKKLGIFGGFKKSAEKQVANDKVVETVEETIVEQAANQQSAEEALLQPGTKTGKKIPTQLTGLFGKFKSKK